MLLQLLQRMKCIAKATSSLAVAAKPLAVSGAAPSQRKRLALMRSTIIALAKAQFDDAIHTSPLLETNPDFARKAASLILGKYDDPTQVSGDPRSDGSYIVMGQSVYYTANW